MPGRKYNAGNGYRYGFNGKENDKEAGNAIQDYGMRIFEQRIGRFLSVDPLTKKFPMLSSYQFASNNPIQNIDIDGLEGGPSNNQGLEYIIRIMDRNGIIKNDLEGTKYKYHSTESYNSNQDIFRVSGVITSGKIVKDEGSPCCPTIIRIATYRDVSPAGSAEPQYRLVAFEEKVRPPQPIPNNIQSANNSTNINLPAQFFSATDNGTGRMVGTVPGTDPTQLTPAGQLAVISASAGLVPTTTTNTITGENAAGIPITTTVTSTTNSVITVNVSAGAFGPSIGPSSTPPWAVNTLLAGRQTSVVNTLIGLGIPRANIQLGTLTPNTNPAVNLGVAQTVSTTTNAAANCPSPGSCNPPLTDIKQTWQQ